MRKPWSCIQHSLFPWTHEALHPVKEKLEQQIHILDVEAVVRIPLRGPGALLRARAVLGKTAQPRNSSRSPTFSV